MKNEIQKEHRQLLENLKLIQKTHTVAELSELLSITKNTWHNRMKEPWARFSYDDLRMISRYCKVDFVTLVDGQLGLR